MNPRRFEQQDYIVIAILAACIVLAFYRSIFPSTTEDKILDMMVTILFSTCLVSIINYHFGSSRGSALKDEQQAKTAEKLAEKVIGPLPSSSPVPATVMTTTPAEPSVTPTITTVTQTQEPRP